MEFSERLRSQVFINIAEDRNKKPRKVKHIEMMYDNPDFKGFNRGNSKRKLLWMIL